MIGFLNAYHFDPDPVGYQTQYLPMFLNYIRSVLPGDEIKSYGVGLGQWPTSIAECDGWIISGSSKSAYDSDPWILQLGEFVQQCAARKRKLVGICFGHQLIAHYLGGRTEKSPKGWGVGVREFTVLRHQAWMQPQLEKCALLFSHQDQVVRLPDGAKLLAEDSFCPYQMYSVGAHIFSMQGHPEFTVDFAKARMDTRIDRLGRPTYDAAIKTLGYPTNTLEVGLWIQKFLKS